MEKEISISIRFPSELKRKVEEYKAKHYNSFNGAVLDLVALALAGMAGGTKGLLSGPDATEDHSVTGVSRIRLPQRQQPQHDHGQEKSV